MNKKKNGFSSGWVILSVFVVAVFIGCMLVFRVPFNKTPAQPTQEQTGTPSVKINDMAPALPDSQKTSLLIRHSDSTYEKVVLPKENVDAYITGLPEGDTVVGNVSPTQ